MNSVGLSRTRGSFRSRVRADLQIHRYTARRIVRVGIHELGQSISDLLLQSDTRGAYSTVWSTSLQVDVCYPDSRRWLIALYVVLWSCRKLLILTAVWNGAKPWSETTMMLLLGLLFTVRADFINNTLNGITDSLVSCSVMWSGSAQSFLVLTPPIVFRRGNQ